MSGWVRERVQAAIAAAATLTGNRFGLFVASSLVATSAIVAAAATNQPEASPLASVLGHSLASQRVAAPVAKVPAQAEPEPEEEAVPEPVGAESSPPPAPSIEPTPLPESTPVPVEAAPEPEPESEPAPEEAGPAEEEAPVEETAPAPPPKPEAGRIKHVFFVSLQSSGYQAAFGAKPTMPYLSGTLRKQGLLLTDYSVLSEATTPNAIAAVSGQPPNKKTEAECTTLVEFPPTAKSVDGVVGGDGCVYPVETLTLPDQLAPGGFIWKGYFEEMMSPTTGAPENCVHPGPEEKEEPETGGYSARLNPFTHFHSLLDLGACASEDVPITELKKDLKSEASTANFSYISPDLCAGGVSGQCPEGAPEAAVAADKWLSKVVPEILASPAYKKDGLLIVTFGGVNPPAEPAEGEPAPPPSDPLKTGALLVSKFVTKNSTDAAPYTPYSLLRTNEELFGLTTFLGKAAAESTRTLGPALLGTGG